MQDKSNILYKIRHPHFRIITLTVYLIFVVVFNLIVAPVFGMNVVPETVQTAAVIDTSRLVQLANQSRAANNLPALTIDQRLVNAATNKANNMFQEQYWAHYGPNGETPWQFINAAGFKYTYAGENLAKDFTSTDPVHNAWMNSATHKANILNQNYKNIGIAAISGKQICNGTYPGFADNNLQSCNDTIIIVEMFGTPVGSTDPVVIPTPTPKPAPTATPKPIPTKTATPIPTLTPTPSPIVTPTLQSPVAPNIIEPKNNSLLKENKIDIQGTTEDGTTVEIYEGEKKIGSILSNSATFDLKGISFEEGDHVIKANAVKSQGTQTVKSSFSPDVKFIIDSTKPTFSKSDVKIQSKSYTESEYYIEALLSADTVSAKVVAGEVNVTLEKQENNFYGNIKVPSGSIGVVLYAYDRAGNEYSEQILLPQSSIGQNVGLTTPTTPTNSGLSLSTKQIINIIIGFVLLVVFILDSIIVWKTGDKHIRNVLYRDKNKNLSKHHHAAAIHHIAPVFIVVIAMLTASFGGTIL